MKNMHIRYAALLLFVLLSASASSFAQTVLEQKISAISAIKEIRPLETSEFSEKYVTYFCSTAGSPPSGERQFSPTRYRFSCRLRPPHSDRYRRLWRRLRPPFPIS